MIQAYRFSLPNCYSIKKGTGYAYSLSCLRISDTYPFGASVAYYMRSVGAPVSPGVLNHNRFDS